MKLADYNKKRKFDQTPEPAGDKLNKAASKLRFVIHKHEATSLHFDLRLEIDGVLVSWAVPKGLPTEAGDKNLAMQVEDHPYSYKDFEGLIPEGNYGAGPVMIWDEGYYHHISTTDPKLTQEKIKKKMKEEGEFKFVLHGKKLKGEFAMFRFKKAGENAWLVIKHDDEYAGRKIAAIDRSARSGLTMKEIAGGKLDEVSSLKKSKLPEKLAPMLATLTSALPEGANWVYELKWDGYRMIAIKQGKKVKLLSRNGKDYSDKFPDIVSALAKLKGDFTLDGEVVVNDEDGVPNFGLIQDFLSGTETKAPIYYLFDLLHWQDKSLTDLELRQRLHLLNQNIKESKFVKLSVSSPDLNEMLKFARQHGLEGLLAKDLSSKYQPDKRSDKWQKLKIVKEDEFVIVGYIPKGSEFKSLALGRFEDAELKYCGQVGSGFVAESNQKLLKQLAKEKSDNRLDGFPNDVQAVTPKFIAQIRYTNITDKGQLRHPVFLGLREDKSINDLKQDSTKTKHEFPIEITNSDKVYFPELGLTKGDVVSFYEQISKYLLPYLAGRPISMHRHPNGIHGESFFQKDFEQDHPDFVQTVKIPRDEDVTEKDGSIDKDITYFICNNLKALLFLANLGVIEIHPWYSRVLKGQTHKQQIASLEKPDFMLFDLDPGSEVSKSQLQEATLLLHEYLDNLKVAHFVKTSGIKGLHIYSPLNRKYSYEQARDFVKLVGIKLVDKYPDLLTLERDPDLRRGKVYVDYAQNRHRHTTVSVYSLRPTEFAGVSTPLTWAEIEKGIDIKDFNYHTVLPRLKAKGDLWSGVMGKAVDLKKALSLI